jgi:Zn-dependent protease
MDPNRFRRPDRDLAMVALAGPAASFLVAAVASVLLRVLPLSAGPGTVLFGFVYANLTLCVVQLMPVPGLDGSMWLARLLPPRARGFYADLSQYLVLWILLLFFLLGILFLEIVGALTDMLFNLLVGVP